jgi:ABC-type phosphate/phosphonate transport system substrate-binding protein
MRTASLLLGLLALLLALGGMAHAADDKPFTIGVMQAQKGDAQKYGALMEYLKAKGIQAQIIGLPGYAEARKSFLAGDLDAMFAGSGVAGEMLLKGEAAPLVRGQTKDKISTYWAVIVARKGTPAYTGDPSIFEGKKVICTAVASSGEYFYKAIIAGAGKTINAKLLIAPSHNAAIEAVANDAADYAIVKNRVWDKLKGKYDQLEQVGSDKGENPDGTLMVSVKADQQIAGQIASAMLAVGEDTSESAVAVKSKLGIECFIKTDRTDFSHTLQLLQQAGVQ